MKNNLKLGIIIFISIVVPIFVQNIFRDQPSVEGSSLMVIFWMFANFLFLFTITELFGEYSKVFRLEELKINRLNYILQISIYVIFTVFLNLYILRVLFLQNNKTLTLVTSPAIVGLILAAFLLNLVSGLFANKEDVKDTNVYTFSNKNSFRTGRDLLNTAGGSYKDGLILGSLIVPYNSMKSIYMDKNNNFIIKGKDENGNYRISCDSEKTIRFFLHLVQGAIDGGKIDEKIVKLN